MTAECKHEGCDGAAYKVGYCNAHYMRSRKGTDMDRPVGRRGADPRRFWKKVERTDGCWEWTAFRGLDGYGRFMIAGSPKLAHRVSFARNVGPIPEGAEIDHMCHNRGCVNPSHLRVATRFSNGQNMAGARIDSASGVRGVRLCASGKWQAAATANGIRFHLGRFETVEEADTAVSEWRRINMPYSLMDQRKAS